MSSLRETPDQYWDRLGEKVLDEVERRLDGEDAKSLPGTLLMRLAELYMKRLEREAAKEEGEQTFMTPMEAIDQEGLPDETKVEILDSYIENLEGDVIAAVMRREEVRSDIQALHESAASEE